MVRKTNPLETTVAEIVAITLASLGSAAVVAAPGSTMTRGGTLISTTLAVSFIGPVSGEAPVLYGIARKDLTAAEVEEYLEIGGPVTPSDIVGMERASRGRSVKTLGVIGPGRQVSEVAEIPSEFLQNVRIAMRFSEEEAGWDYWALNLSTSAFSAGSQSLRFVAQHFVRFNPSG